MPYLIVNYMNSVMAHPYCKSINRFAEEYPNTEETHIFIEMYPSARFHLEALTELLMVADIYAKGYQKITIFLKTWNISLSEKDKQLVEKWERYIRTFLVEKYKIDWQKINILGPSHFNSQDGSKLEDTLESSNLDFEPIGLEFAAVEYWPWDELSEEEKRTKASKEGKMSYLGLCAFLDKTANDKNKKWVVIRPASTKNMTEKIIKDIGGEQDWTPLDIFYTDDAVSLCTYSHKSFLKEALEQSQIMRVSRDAMNSESNNILNHFDTTEVITSVLEVLLDSDSRWIKESFINRKNVSTSAVMNAKFVAAEFQRYKAINLKTPVSESLDLLLCLEEHKEVFNEICKEYYTKKEEWPTTQSLPQHIKKDLTEAEKSIDKLRAEDKNIIKNHIIQFKKEKKQRGKGAPSKCYKIPLDRQKIKFHLIEEFKLN